MFLMWLGEQITQRGIGNGISLIIFAGIVAEIPRALVTTFELGRTGAVSTFMILAIFILLVATILFLDTKPLFLSLILGVLAKPDRL